MSVASTTTTTTTKQQRSRVSEQAEEEEASSTTMDTPPKEVVEEEEEKAAAATTTKTTSSQKTKKKKRSNKASAASSSSSAASSAPKVRQSASNAVLRTPLPPSMFADADSNNDAELTSKQRKKLVGKIHSRVAYAKKIYRAQKFSHLNFLQRSASKRAIALALRTTDMVKSGTSTSGANETFHEISNEVLHCLFKRVATNLVKSALLTATEQMVLDAARDEQLIRSSVNASNGSDTYRTVDVLHQLRKDLERAKKIHLVQ
jgi:hypothetical protein